MNKLNKRLDEIEKNILTNRPKGKTHITMDDPSEIALHQEANEIRQFRIAAINKLIETFSENPNIDIDKDLEALELSPHNQQIIDRSDSFVLHRVLEVFDDIIGMPIHQNDLFYKYLFNARLGWFLRDMIEWFSMRRQEDRILSQPGFSDLCWGEQQKQLAPLYANWKRDLLSEESWKRYYNKHPMQIKESTNQELKEFNKENKQFAKDEAKILKHKCSNLSLIHI